jgi:hypothetical protein
MVNLATDNGPTVQGSGSGTSGDLRYCISQANANTNSDGSLIEFDSGVFSTPQTITLSPTFGPLELSEAAGPEVIEGPGASPATINGNNAVQDFRVDSGTMASFSALTITGGGLGQGGGISNRGKLTMVACAVSGNTAVYNGGGGGIYNQGVLSMSDCTISNNISKGYGFGGGGIGNGRHGTLVMSDCTLSGNSADIEGGGIESTGTVRMTGCTLFDNHSPYGSGGGMGAGGPTLLTDCTISGNSAAGFGCGLGSYGPLELNNCTISGNTATTGAGIYNYGGTAVAAGNTIIAGNLASSSPDVYGPFNSQGNNLIGQTDGSSGWVGTDLTGTVASPLDPKLGSLANNGGPTQTVALLAGSPAIDAGNNALAVDPTGSPLVYDQRGPGFLRFLGSAVDIGAFEAPAPVTTANLQAAINATTPGTPVTVQTTTNAAVTAAIQAVNEVTNPNPGTPVTVTLDLGGSTLTTDTHVAAQPGVTLQIVDGTLVGGSPALIVDSGVVVLNHITAANATNAPTIRVEGGSLTIRNSTIQESTGYSQAAILIEGGSVDLGTSSDPGGNVISVNGAGELVHNTTSSTVPDFGNALEVNGAVLSSPDLSFTALGSSGTTSVYGQQVTLSATVRADSPADGTPTGTVDFVDTTTGTDLGTSPVSGGVAQLTIASLAAGTHAITARYLGDGSFAFSLDGLTQTVSKAPLTVTDNQTKLYGASVILSPSYSGFVLGQTFTTAGITGSPTLGTTATATSDVGSYQITVGVGPLSAANYSFAAVSGTLTVNAQTAVSASYTGLLYVATASASTSTATVGLSVTVKDSSGGAGNISNATVTFVNRVDGSTIAANLPVSLVNPADVTTGTASYNWSVNIGSNNSQSFTIGIIVGHDYARNDSGDNAVVTVSKPQAGSATGGGYLVNESSAGAMPGDAGAKTNFGFEAKNGSKGLQGQTNVIVRYLGRVYQYNATTITSLAFPTGKTANYAGTGTIQDITNPSSPVTLYTGAALQVTMTDNGDPGTSDTIGITIRTPAGALWYASAWNGTATVEQSLGNGNGGGNLQVRPAQEAAGGPALGTTAAAPLTPDEIGPIAAEALARWAAAGIDAQRLNALNHVVFRIDDLSGSDLGWARQGVITLDRTADGFGWFVDATPGDDSEFSPGVFNSPARGHIDLLSVVAHETGHLLGFGEDSSSGVTGEYLAPGARHVPVPGLAPPAATVMPGESAPLSTSMPGARSSIEPISRFAGRTPAVVSPTALLPGSSGTTDGLMALDLALADWSGAGGRETPRSRLLSRTNAFLARTQL